MPDQDSRQSKTDFNDIAKNYGAAKVQQYLSQAESYQNFRRNLNEVGQNQQLSSNKAQNHSKIRSIENAGLELS